ncbi:DUF2937 family protein [Thalassotalea sp. G2M2-11]|uniref:DUF2937 family protein n=1 Tax=Thalassotalea sp. G2M2-11 TaxID=2787627 RepID=UPI0019D3114A|nr:DUF2937 family protein [Thalassotalea sp. G2M2-11]
MLGFLNQLLDKCIFTVVFICGVQLPEFINQYSQRLSGHLNEANLQLAQFKQLAELHHQGNLHLLIRAYKQNSDPSVVDTATIIEQLVSRVNYLQQHLHNMLSPSYWQKIQQLVINGDVSIMEQTAKIFSLAIPLELTALATGAILALSVVLLKSLSIYLITRLFNADARVNV